MGRPLHRGWIYVFILGVFFTLRGYHSRDGDQAYRLPLLLHQQDPKLYADDPFVRAFDDFNPHRGYLILLDLASHPLGLSFGLAALFVATFALTCFGLSRLARACWPELGGSVEILAVVLVLLTKAGNIGTNHLFEAMLLDRLVGFALGWTALAFAIEKPERGWWASPLVLGLAIFVHPGVGLQLGLLLGGSWLAWAFLPSRTEVDLKRSLLALGALGLALSPGLFMNLGEQGRIFEGLPAEEFRLLSLEVQGPQHMLPHLWRFPQWLAWGCFPLLAALSFRVTATQTQPLPSRSSVQARLAIVLGVGLLGLGGALFGVEILQDLRVTLFQPFRMATIFRGLVLVVLSGRLLLLWNSGLLLDRTRAVLLVAGLSGDRSLAVATAFDILLEGLTLVKAPPRLRLAVGLVCLGLGLRFLSRHDTESGHLPLLAALVLLLVWTVIAKRWTFVWNRRRLVFAMSAAWVVPVAALIVGFSYHPKSTWQRSLLSRCRFSEAPTDDVERLAIWCRDHTPPDSRFIGPPGPKTFRLWSHRSLAFNRAASPYHAAGLADWSTRFRDHVGFQGPTTAFVQAYQADRHGLERRYQEMGDKGRARLAAREGASYVIAAAPEHGAPSVQDGPLQLLHVEGRYAVYHVSERETSLANREAVAGRR